MGSVPFHLNERSITRQLPDDEPSRLNRRFRRAGKNTLRVLLPAVLALVAYQKPVQALDPNRNISQYAHNAWTIQDGDLPGRAYAMAQTADGYLWIGTEGGLLRFDGVRFDASSPPVQQQPALHSAHIGDLLGARDGSLWISAELGRGHWVLSRWTGKELLKYPLTGVGNTGLYQTRSGDVWTTAPPCQISGSAPRCFGKAEGLPDTLRDLAEDAHGYFWSGSEKSLFRWKPGTPAVTVYSPAGLQAHAPVASSVKSIVVAPDGSVWAGMTARGPGMGLEHLVQGRWTAAIAPGVDGSTWQVQDLLFDRDGGLWIGTSDEGLYHLYGQRVDHYRSTDGLSSDLVLTLYEDREGNVWALTARGIDRFRGTAVTTFSRRDGLCSQEAVSLLAAHDGTLWVGGEDALTALQGDRIVCFPTAKRLPGHQITSLFEDHAHQLWVGVDDNMGIYEHDHFTPITKADGTPPGMIVSIAEDVDHDIWMVSGGHHRALFRVRNRTVTEEPALPGIPAPHAVAADPAGGLWLGLMNGDLARYRDGHAELVHVDHPEGGLVTQVAVSSDGSVLAASGSGLLGWKNGKPQLLTARNGLPCDAVSAFVTDDSGSLWLYLHCGYVEITAAQLQQWWSDPSTVLTLHVLDALDGMQPGGAWFQNVSAKTPDGRLWFGGEVLQMINPAAGKREGDVAPLVHVENVIADQKHYALGSALELPALTRNLEIDYTAPVFAIPQRVRYRYKLEGSDHDWQDAGARREALYTNLGPGRYTFRVIASSNGGAWSANGASVGFRIASAFYQTAWFYALCGIAGLALLATLYRVRVRQVAAQVLGRMEARLAERERIARELHDTLLQGMQGLIWRFQAATNHIPRDQPARQLMEQSLDRADSLLAESRDMIKDLRQASGDVSDLAQALAAEGEQFASLHSAEFRVTVQGARRDVQPIVREEGFVIGREALSNAFRHSGAKNIEVDVTYGEAALQVRVRDDGRGIGRTVLQAGRRPGHFGLIGMRERAKMIGGHLEIWSKPDAGTEVDLRVPARVAYSRSQALSVLARSWRAIFRTFAQQH